MMAKSREQRWAEGYYGALVGLTVRKVEIVCDESAEHYGMPVEWWPTITLVADDGEEFVVEVSRDPEGNGAGFLFGLPTFSAPEVACERCSEGIDFYDPSNFENLSALEVGPEEMVCASCVTRVERGWIDTIIHAGESKKSDIWPEYAGECDICDLPVLYGQDEHNRETGNHLDCDERQEKDRPSPRHNRSSYLMPFNNVADEIEKRTGQRPYLDMTGGGILTVGMSLAKGHFPTVDYEMEKMPWVHLANYGLEDDGEVLFEDFYRPTFGVFLSGDGSYCGDIYNTDGLDYKSERYRMLDEWHDRISSLVEVDDDEKTSMSADEFVDHVVKVWEMWKRERHNVPEGVVTGLEVTA